MSTSSGSSSGHWPRRTSTATYSSMTINVQPSGLRLAFFETVFVAAEEGVGCQIGIESGLELGLKVASGDLAQDLAIGVAQARVASPSPPSAFFKKLVTNTHSTSLPQGCDDLVSCFTVDACGHLVPLGGGLDGSGCLAPQVWPPGIV
jgi:hypothetical protein